MFTRQIFTYDTSQMQTVLNCNLNKIQKNCSGTPSLRLGNVKLKLPSCWSSSKCGQQFNPKLRPQTTTRSWLWRRWCNFQRVSHVSDMDVDTALPSIANETLLIKAIALRLDYILCLICLLCLWTGLIFSSFCHFISSSFCLFFFVFLSRYKCGRTIACKCASFNRSTLAIQQLLRAQDQVGARPSWGINTIGASAKSNVMRVQVMHGHQATKTHSTSKQKASSLASLGFSHPIWHVSPKLTHT